MSEDYDLFVSHSHLDTERVKALVGQWREWGHRIFADFDDHVLIEASRLGKMDSKTSEHLRRSIGNCKVFIFIASANSAGSHWMPWELGLAHGRIGRVHLYLLDETAPAAFENREYLELYRRHCFNRANAESYLRKVVGEARSEASDPAQIEKALGMGRMAAEALMNGRYDDLLKPFSRSPREQGAATIEGFSNELPSGSTTSTSQSIWNAWTGGTTKPKKGGP